MSQQDANFNPQIFRKDNPIILAMRRDLASFIGVRLVYNAAGYLPGQVIARTTSTGLFSKYSAVSGGTIDTVCVLFDQCSADDQAAVESPAGTTTGISGSSLVRAIAAGYVYTGSLIDYSSGAKTALGSADLVDSGGNAITKF
jgi:hypothetical protein